MRNHYVLLTSLCLMALPGTLWAQLPWSATSPTPDSYGYTWRTNSAPNGPAYIWEDITGIGTEITGLNDDGNSGPIPIGFDFPYYWYSRDQVWVADNGFLAFSSTPIGSTVIGFPPTPTPDDPNDVIAPFMADMNPTGAGNPGQVFYYSDTINKRFIVSWENMPFWVPPTTSPNQWAGSNSFQVILDANDSTITFQYKSQVGNWATSYNDADYPFVVGIENTTGTFGLMVPPLPNAAANSLKPVGNTAIRFYPPTQSSANIIDVAVSNLQNDEIQAFFVPWEAPPASANPEFLLYSGLTNVGNQDVQTAIAITSEVRNLNNSILFLTKDTLQTGLAAGETHYFQSAFPFYPPTAGSYSYNVRIDNPTIYGDINPNNDSRSNEAVVVDTTVEEVYFDYTSGNLANLDPNLGGGIIAWSGNNGNSGAGVRYKSFGYPLKINAIEFFVGTSAQDSMSEGFLAQIHAVDTANGAVPGPLLFSDTVLHKDIPSFPVGGSTPWVRVELDTPLVIESDGFYVSWIQRNDSTNLFTEGEPAAGTASGRSFEILGGGWSVWRTNSTEELWIRAAVDLRNAEPDVNTSIDEQMITELADLRIYPNPSQGIFTVDLSWTRPQPAEVKLFDLQGRKVLREVLPSGRQVAQELNLSHLESGVYLLQVTGERERFTRKVVIQ